MKFPNKLRQIRDKTPKSQDDLADALGAAGIKNATKQKVNKIEKGNQRITPMEAEIFARVLGCSTGDILPGISISTPPISPQINQNSSAEAIMNYYKGSTEEARNGFDDLYEGMKRRGGLKKTG